MRLHKIRRFSACAFSRITVYTYRCHGGFKSYYNSCGVAVPVSCEKAWCPAAVFTARTASKTPGLAGVKRMGSRAHCLELGRGRGGRNLVHNVTAKHLNVLCLTYGCFCLCIYIAAILMKYIYSRSALEHQPSKCTLCLVSICVNKTIQRGTHPRRKEWCSTENGGERDTTSNCVCVYTQEGLSSCWYREVCGDKTHFGGNFQNNHIG